MSVICILFKEQYRVKWQGYSEEESTWEPIRNLADCIEEVIKFNEKLAQNKKGSDSSDCG